MDLYEESQCDRKNQELVSQYNRLYDAAIEGQYEVAEKKVRELDNQVGSLLFSYKHDSAYKAVEKVNPNYEGYSSKDELYSKLEEAENNHKGALAYKEVLLLDENYYPKEKLEFLSQIAAYSKVYEDFYW